MKQIEIIPEKLFKIELVNEKWNKTYKTLVNQKSLDFYTKWWKDYTLTIEEELSPVSFEGVTLETEGPRKVGRCYHVQNYKLTSPRPLDDFSLDVLRAYGLFMGGQREGYLVSKEEVDGNYIYNLKSERDSSD
jgi:hypothetical protein